MSNRFGYTADGDSIFFLNSDRNDMPFSGIKENDYNRDYTGGVHYDHVSNTVPWRVFYAGYSTVLYPNNFPNDMVFGGARDSINDYLLPYGSAPYAGLVPLITQHLLITDKPSTDMLYRPIGFPPNVFAVNLSSFDPEEEVTIGGVTYKLFPASRKSEVNYITYNKRYPVVDNSFFVGYAYPKDI